MGEQAWFARFHHINARPLPLLSALLALAGSGAYLFWRLWGGRADLSDFRLIWLAGRMWGQGIDPYSNQFMSTFSAHLPHSIAVPWFYPFHWYCVAVLLGWPSLDIAYRLFMLTMIVASFAMALLMYRTAVESGVRASRAGWLFLLAYCLSSTMWQSVLRNGQPAIIPALGLPIILLGLRRSNQVLVVVGLVSMLGKPQIGVSVWMAVAALEGWFLPALAAAALSVLLSLPALLVGGGLPVVWRFLAVTSSYQRDVSDQSVSMTGIAQIYYQLTSGNMPLAVTAGLGSVAALFTGIFLRRRKLSPSELTAGFAVTIPLVIAAFVSLHPYDLIILSFTLPFVLKFSGAALAPFALGYAILWRPETICRIWSHTTADVGAVATVGLVALIVGAILLLPAISKVPGGNLV